jgi:TPR repeat protein
MMYANGQGVEQNSAEADKWYDKALSGDGIYRAGDAMFRQGLRDIYGKDINGRAGKQNTKEGVKLILKLADSGFNPAMFYAGRMYLKGENVEQNFKEAMRWSAKAAEKMLPGAQYNIGMMYAQGQGVARDYIEAYKWLLLALEGYHKLSPVRGDPTQIEDPNSKAYVEFFVMMGMCVPDVDEQLKNVEKQLMPEQKKQAENKAREIKEAHIKFLRENYGYRG